MRIGIIALLQETNTFISEPTTIDHFVENLIVFGDDVQTHFAGTDHEVGGFFEKLEETDHEVVPLFAARALPFGTVTDETYAALLDELLRELRGAGTLDGLLVAPHGATVSKTVRDVDGDWLTKVREIVGPDVPIISTADPHGNLSPKMIAAVDAITAYRTNPHIDQRARGIEAADRLLRTLAGEIRPVTAAVFPPLFINIDKQCSEEEPCHSLLELAAEMRSRPGVLSTSLFLGFPYADVPEMGSAFAVVTDGDRDLAQQLANEFAAVMWERRHEFVADLIDVESAVQQAIDAPESPVLLLDMGDNVGGGSAADGTALVHELHRQKVNAFICLNDPQAVYYAEKAGIGNYVQLSVGGTTDNLHGEPFTAKFIIHDVTDGQFEEPEARHGGMRHFDQGRTAIVIADTGLTVMLTSRRMVPFSLHQLTDFGIDPSSFKVIVAKGVNAPIAAYAPVCPKLIRVNTPGATTADVMSLEYHHRRRPMFPFEDKF
ncbi:MAG: M81 family metallopeptidase [Planctomycetaceae bacterium]|nr:M81 family metallopeptidase [Planctomycetaceae bacterium]